MRSFASIVLLATLTVGAGSAPARSGEMDPQQRAAIDKGLKWLVRQQAPDGHFEANQGCYASAMTALAGMCFLMEGSTLRDGKYAANVRKCVDWLTERVQRNGCIGDPNANNQGLGYLYGHGFSTMFLSQIYGEEEDNDRRKKLEKILTDAVIFIGNCQTSRGGWGYISAKEGNDFDEGSVTITQVQALRAARNAGIQVPIKIIDRTRDYLRKCTTQKGGMIYSLSNGGGPERPTITVAAIACMFSTGEYSDPLAKQWLKYVDPLVPIDKMPGKNDQFGHSEYTYYYYAQVLYSLGDDGYEKLFPGTKPDRALTWSRFHKGFISKLIANQNADGSWTGTPIGPVYTTCCYLTVLQLENNTLPIYQR
jgi:hypothetical protein